LLDVAADGKEHSMKEARDVIAKRMNIADADLREMLPSGTQTKYDNRVAWAKSYFVQANVFELHFQLADSVKYYDSSDALFERSRS
jgi:restriction system protein